MGEIDEGWYWEPSPPDDHQLFGTHLRHVMIEDDLMHAETYPLHLAYHLSGAMHSVELAVERGEILQSELRDRMMPIVVRLHARSRFSLPLIEGQVLTAGFQGLIGQVLWLAQSAEERSAWSDEDVADVRVWARILRNDLHNASILAHRMWWREQHRSGRFTTEVFVARTREQFARMARNAIHNEELRQQLESRSPPDFGVRLSA